MTTTPLYDALVAHKKLNRASFHTPGHKNLGNILPLDLFALDFTELPDTDSLYDANGSIRQAEERAAELFGSKRTLFSAGGCTLCIQTMLKLTVPFGGKVIASRMIHKSAVNTLALLNANVIWIVPQFDKNNGNFKQISAKQVEDALTDSPDVSCVYITSPDYFGNIADIKQISQACKKYQVPLLVDNAHGSHLKFLSNDIHPITLGADLVADSVHKTLPVLTGGALLHIANEAFIEPAKAAMSVWGSTSPSYLIMTSIDIATSWLRKNAKMAYLKLESEIALIKRTAQKRGFSVPECSIDPTRLALYSAQLGFTGNEAAEYFREHGLEPELSTCDSVVFIATPMNTREDFDRLLYAIDEFPKKDFIFDRKPMFELSLAQKSLHEAFFGVAEMVDCPKAIGKISAATVCPCPPGIPILVPGEVVTKSAIQNLSYYGIKTINVLK